MGIFKINFLTDFNDLFTILFRNGPATFRRVLPAAPIKERFHIRWEFADNTNGIFGMASTFDSMR